MSLKFRQHGKSSDSNDSSTMEYQVSRQATKDLNELSKSHLIDKLKYFPKNQDVQQWYDKTLKFFYSNGLGGPIEREVLSISKKEADRVRLVQRDAAKRKQKAGTRIQRLKDVAEEKQIYLQMIDQTKQEIDLYDFLVSQNVETPNDLSKDAMLGKMIRLQRELLMVDRNAEQDAFDSDSEPDPVAAHTHSAHAPNFQSPSSMYKTPAGKKVQVQIGEDGKPVSKDDEDAIVAGTRLRRRM